MEDRICFSALVLTVGAGGAGHPGLVFLTCPPSPTIAMPVLLCLPLGDCAEETVSRHNGKYAAFGSEARLSWNKSLNFSESQFTHL